MEGKLRIAQTDGSGREIGDEKIRMVNGSRQAMPKKKNPIAAQPPGKSNLLKATRENGEITFLHD